MNKHPLSHISPQSRPAVFTVLLAAIFLNVLILNLTDSLRRTDEASVGIISPTN